MQWILSKRVGRLFVSWKRVLNFNARLSSPLLCCPTVFFLLPLWISVISTVIGIIVITPTPAAALSPFSTGSIHRVSASSPFPPCQTSSWPPPPPQVIPLKPILPYCDHIHHHPHHHHHLWWSLWSFLCHIIIIISYYIISYHIISYHIISYHIISYFIKSKFNQNSLLLPISN